MTERDLRDRLSTRQRQVIEEARVPSSQMLNRVEAALNDPDTLAGYAETLVPKVEETEGD